MGTKQVGSLPQAPRAEPPPPLHGQRVWLLGAVRCRMHSPVMSDLSLVRSPVRVHQRVAASRRRHRAHRRACLLSRPGRQRCPRPLCRTLRLALAMNAERNQAPGCSPKATPEWWKGRQKHSQSGCGNRGDEGPTCLPLPGCGVYRQDASRVCPLALDCKTGSCERASGASRAAERSVHG